MSPQPLHPLTSLRFLAAGAVLLHHRPQAEGVVGLPYEGHGAAGVTFFFLLSGFILAYSYRTRLVPWAPREGWNFLVARFARIWPVYLLAFVLSLWVCVDGTALLALKFGGAVWRALAHLTMTQALVPNVHWFAAFNAPGWSLSCEWTFYLLFPLLLNGLATGSWGRRAAVFVAASAGWLTATVLYFTASGAAADPWWWTWLVYISPLTRVFDFTCGVGLGLLFAHVRPAVGPARGARFWVWGVVEAGAAAALWAAVHFCPVPHNRALETHLLSGLGYYLPFFAVIVWVGALGRGPLSRLASARVPVYLGEISYGVYIFHFPLLALLVRHFHPAGWSPEARVWGIVALTAASAMAVSAASYHLYELPLRHWLRKKLAWNAPASAPVEVAPPTRRAA